MSSSSAWRLRGATATLAGSEIELNVDRIAEGLRGVPGVSGAVLKLRPPGGTDLTFEDAYCRGADLIAAYSPTAAFPFRTEVYWRAEFMNASRVEPRLSLIVSVETDLLDSRPELLVETTLPAATAELLRASGDELSLRPAGDRPATAALVRRTDEGPTWFEAVHPSDQGEAFLTVESGAGNQVELRWRLFSRFLEKGVIRRARLMAAPLPNGAATLANEHYQRFAAESPPLTV